MNENQAVHRRPAHSVYQELHDSEEFAQLRRSYRGFIVPWTVVFLVWYFLYVILSNWAGGFMGAQLFGNINVALVFGLLQFVSTFAIAWLYGRHMNRRVDGLARHLEERYNAESGEVIR